MSIKDKYIIRFTRLNRTLHIFMIVSFLILSLTGMSLKFSYTGWAQVRCNNNDYSICYTPG